MDFAEQEDLIDRLDNWGRVYGETRSSGWKSSLLGVMRARGFIPEHPDAPAASPDRADAEIINAGWVKMRMSKEKRFLRDTFMHPGRPRWRVWTEVGIKEHLYAEMLSRALRAIARHVKPRYTDEHN